MTHSVGLTENLFEKFLMSEDLRDIAFSGEHLPDRIRLPLEFFLGNEPESLDLLPGLAKKGCFQLFKDGHHAMTFSRAEWKFVLKILKEEDQDDTVLERHLSALRLLKGLIAGFMVIRKSGRSVVVQEKLPWMLDDRLSRLAKEGSLSEAGDLVKEYVELNVQTWNRGMFDWHFRIDHVGLNQSGKIVLFDIGGVRGKPSPRDRVRWRFGYFGRKHRRNMEILSAIHLSLADTYRSASRAKLKRTSAERAILGFYKKTGAQ